MYIAPLAPRSHPTLLYNYVDNFTLLFTAVTRTKSLNTNTFMANSMSHIMSLLGATSFFYLTIILSCTFLSSLMEEKNPIQLSTSIISSHQINSLQIS